MPRLRDHFGDAPPVQVGRRMQLTSLGEMLIDLVRDALRAVEATPALRPEFDLATANGRFAICAAEATVPALLNEVLREVDLQAPNVSAQSFALEHARWHRAAGRRQLHDARLSRPARRRNATERDSAGPPAPGAQGASGRRVSGL